MKRLRLAVVLAGVVGFVATDCVFGADEWEGVKDGKRGGISGMALIEAGKSGGSFLIVHDNKKPEDVKCAVVTVGGEGGADYKALAWAKGAPDPVDFESLCAVPGTKSEYLAVMSNGDVFHLKLVDGKTLELLGRFSWPDTKGKNFEGVGLYEKDGVMAVVWAHRGEGAPGELFWGALDLAKHKVSAAGSARITVPWPAGNQVRSISDLTIDDQGSIYISSAFDPGDDGPFDAALYLIGKIAATSPEVALELLPKPEEVCRAPGHKVEGIVLMPGSDRRFFVGTDDENKGSSVRFLP
ncbi:MAG: hypothetical protein E4H02_08875 [Lentisphaerales bacterium]|jgi:hypothetical protein|nr:MAG: hypothetical protein E4H02_08875 [Lentisphaerales bacterium]